VVPWADVVGVEFWSGGEAYCLPAELVLDRAFVRVCVFGGHWLFRSRNGKWLRAGFRPVR